MECANCESTTCRQFYCVPCLRNHFRDFKRQTHHFAADRDEQVLKAKKSLQSYVEPARIQRAALFETQTRLEEIQNALGKLRKDNERKREKLRMLREGIATRRQTLSAARLLSSSSSSASPSNNPEIISSLRSLSSTITHARQGLIQELIEVFNIVQVGGRPPIGGKAGTKGEWTICDLILPVPGDMRRYPPDHINTVLTHTIHFIGLLTFYLGIKLPFEIIWSSTQPPPPPIASCSHVGVGKLGAGQPWIGATRGIGMEYGGWARWTTRHPLHLIQTPSTPSTPTTPTNTNTLPPIPNPEDSILLAPDNTSTNPNFPTALTMLLYNVSYLGFTQNVDIPLNQAGDILSNLWSICCSGDLGTLSHSTTTIKPLLPPPTPPSFPLDFTQLLQATTLNPRVSSTRVGPRKRRSSTTTTTTTTTKTTRPTPPILEEEGWDIVDDGYTIL